MQGLQVFDASGNLVVDNTTRLTLYLGELTLTKGINQIATITDTRLANGRPFYLCSNITSRGSVAVGFSGNTMTARLVDGLSSGNNYSVHFIYGVY